MVAKISQLSLELEASRFSEPQLAGIALALSARSVKGWSREEEMLAKVAVPPTRRMTADIRHSIENGEDPLGSRFCETRSAEARRPFGATYTPSPIVAAMVSWWSESWPKPERIVDPGTGSGRYLIAAGRRFPDAALVGFEIDPLAAIIARANLAAAGLASRAQIHLLDYRAAVLPSLEGPTFFIGNPPYVRHHLIGEEWKKWFVDEASAAGYSSASRLAGLHVYFFLATLRLAKLGDRGAFVTAAEWLDVNYGRVVRELLLGDLGGSEIHVVEASAQPFPDAATTAAITCFELKKRQPVIRLRRVDNVADLAPLAGGNSFRRERLASEARWSPLTRAVRAIPDGYVELGELCRVHRGAVTGANRVWIADESTDLPASTLFRSITKARELFGARGTLSTSAELRNVIDLPVDLDVFDQEDRRRIDRFLRRAHKLGAATGYVAQNRRAWWSVGLRNPAPILATYMARRPPAFVRNLADARHINIAHGLYPREEYTPKFLDLLAAHLSSSTSVIDGRTYAGGLTKFEPREMERLLVPTPAMFLAGTT